MLLLLLLFGCYLSYRSTYLPTILSAWLKLADRWYSTNWMSVLTYRCSSNFKSIKYYTIYTRPVLYINYSFICIILSWIKSKQRHLIIFLLDCNLICSKIKDDKLLKETTPPVLNYYYSITVNYLWFYHAWYLTVELLLEALSAIPRYLQKKAKLSLARWEAETKKLKRYHVVVVIVVSHMPWGQMPNRHVVKCVSSVALLFSSFSRTAQTRDKYHTHLHVLFVAVFDIFPFSSFSSLELDSSLSHCLSVDRLSDFSVSAFLSWV